MKKFALSFSCILILTFSFAQQISLADYNRAVSFLGSNISKNIVWNTAIRPTWLRDGSGFTFSMQDSAGSHKKNYDFETGLITDSKNENGTQNGWGERRSTKRNMESESPDKAWTAFVKDYNLFIKKTGSGAEKQLSFDGAKNYEYASYYGWGEIIEGENGDRPEHFDVSWSPDGKFIQAFICDLRNAKKMYLLDWSIDTLYKPKLLSYYRGSPGDTDMVYMTPVVFNTQTGEANRLNEFRNVNSIRFEWLPDFGKALILERVRGYQKVNLFLYDVVTKSKELLYTENSETNIDNFNYRLEEEWNQIIFTSEKDGWKQLYALDLKSKKITRLTNGNYYVNDISFINKKSGDIFLLQKEKKRPTRILILLTRLISKQKNKSANTGKGKS
ncbi:DPP IV N-terminal domain-containing protein [Niabella ginsengisoli]|uniref:DPP IV N-terminal domain-containing protein n=1 Tax=Niabella ginsengisoli TaxID=522298 RepID=A0ABS9SNM9_9BACT|nr:DPP IV N-terminal domain-containing protein [Niabella ginsengisoli]MCH5599987.1 DPP IV N-terminal domain-containing protein [Niabella ginsengisoli]